MQRCLPLVFYRRFEWQSYDAHITRTSPPPSLPAPASGSTSDSRTPEAFKEATIDACWKSGTGTKTETGPRYRPSTKHLHTRRTEKDLMHLRRACRSKIEGLSLEQRADHVTSPGSGFHLPRERRNPAAPGCRDWWHSGIRHKAQFPSVE